MFLAFGVWRLASQLERKAALGRLRPIFPHSLVLACQEKTKPIRTASYSEPVLNQIYKARWCIKYK